VGKKNKDDIDEMAETLLTDITSDRDRLSKFFDSLLRCEDVTIMAEAVARIADSLTKQNMLRVAAIKAKIKKQQTNEDDDDSILDEIGRPFQNEAEEGDGSN
jgi:hypothetical protein